MAAIRDYLSEDFDRVYEIINRAAEAYRGVIPADRWHDPYMGGEELQAEIDAGVAFRLWTDEGDVIRGVMGAQPVMDVTLIRHAYVEPGWQGKGAGSALIEDLMAGVSGPVLVGTWAAAGWAIRFYRRHGFNLAIEEEKSFLLNKYWNIPERQVETSVVLKSEA